MPCLLCWLETTRSSRCAAFPQLWMNLFSIISVTVPIICFSLMATNVLMFFGLVSNVFTSCLNPTVCMVGLRADSTVISSSVICSFFNSVILYFILGLHTS